MWYFILKVSPKPDTPLATEPGGAFVNCWIDFREQEGAEHLAKFYLDQEEWQYEETQEARWVEKQDYETILKERSTFQRQKPTARAL